MRIKFRDGSWFSFYVYASGGFTIYYTSYRVRFNWEAFGEHQTLSIQSQKLGRFVFLFRT